MNKYLIILNLPFECLLTALFELIQNFSFLHSVRIVILMLFIATIFVAKNV